MAKKIALVLDTWDYPFNGMVISNQRFVRSLQELDFEFTILSLGADSPGRVGFQKLPVPGANRIMEYMKSPLAMPNRYKLAQVLSDVDLLSVQYPFFLGASAVTLAREMGLPVVCSFHVQPENILRNLYVKSDHLVDCIYHLFNRYFYDRADVTVAPSVFAAGLLKKHRAKANIEIISNGVPEEFLRDTYPLLEHPAQFTILSVGRFAKEKHQKLLIDAISKSKYRHRIKLRLVGTGPTELWLRKLARQAQIELEIGDVSEDELVVAYHNADLFVHASEVELEGMSLLEAMASGLPVVVADAKASAAKDIVVDRRSLFKFPSVDDLTQKIDYYLSSVEARREAQLENYPRALQYSHHHSTARFAALYSRLIESSSHGH